MKKSNLGIRLSWSTKNKMKTFYFLTLFLSFHILAQDDLAVDYFKDLSERYGISPLSQQSFCYQTETRLIGHRQYQLQRIASLSKIFTTYLASENLDLRRQFRTKFYLTKSTLHIIGGEDPYFEEEKLLLLFKALNERGYHHFEKVTFSSEFHFYDLALGRYLKITPSHTRERLRFYLDKKNRSFINKQWSKIRVFAEEEGVKLSDDSPALSAGSVSLNNSLPKDQVSEVFIHDSRPLHLIIKSMNVQSKNYVSENVYSMASRSKSLATLLDEQGISSETYSIQNGSGLPIIKAGSRVDNLSSCETMLKVINLLDKSIKKHDLSLSDILAINGGVDLGSFRERFKEFPETFQSVLAKTGTLKNASSLAGVMLTKEKIPFAILNHTTSTEAARHFQDNFVSKLFDVVGPMEPLIYSKISIFPWDDTAFLVPEN
jgi:D-alanyl-D-alanine carboxypeptidase/D-alanyl-D-alanine-endopeptidase (penicillin-binding protein 4)